MEGRPAPEGRAFFFVVALGAAAGLGAWWTYPHLTAGSGSLHLILLVAALAVLGLPVFMAEGGLGQFRRRNVVDAFGPGPMRAAGAFVAVSAVLAAALVAVVTGWAGRIVIESFRPDFLADPGREFRLLSQGSDAMLGAAAVLAVAAFVTARGIHRGVRPAAVIALSAMFLLLAGLVIYANVLSGATRARSDYFSPDFTGVAGADFVQAAQQALLVVAVGVGLVATLAGNGPHDRKLPRKAFAVALGAVAVVLAIGLFLVPLAAHHDAELSGSDAVFGGLFTTAPELFAMAGESTGAVLAGAFFAALVASGIAAILALLEVPVTFLIDRWPAWGRRRSALLVAMVAYLIAIPLAFSRALVADSVVILSAVLIPLGALLFSLRVGWAGPGILDGYNVGDAQHKVSLLLHPWLRFVTPILCAFLVIVGVMAFFAETGSIERGTGGLWSWVP